MKKTTLAGIASALLLTTLTNSAPAFAGAPMIELREGEGARMTMTDDQGNPATAQAVRIYKDAATGEVRAVEPIISFAMPSVTAGFSAPLGQIVTLGVILGRGSCDANWSWATFGCAAEGMLVEYEFAAQGSEFSVGYETKAQAILLAVIPLSVGYGVKATLLRSWNTDPAAPQGTFAGIEADATFEFVKLSLGLLKRVGGDQPGYDWLPTVSAEIGF